MWTATTAIVTSAARKGIFKEVTIQIKSKIYSVPILLHSLFSFICWYNLHFHGWNNQASKQKHFFVGISSWVALLEFNIWVINISTFYNQLGSYTVKFITFWIKAFDHIIVNAVYLLADHFVIAIMSPARAWDGLQNLVYKPMTKLHWDLLWF